MPNLSDRTLQVREAIRDALHNADHPLTTRQLVATTGEPQSVIYPNLAALERAGDVQRAGRAGTSARAAVYWQLAPTAVPENPEFAALLEEHEATEPQASAPPNVDTVLARADRRWCQDTADDPLDDDRVTALAQAVRDHLQPSDKYEQPHIDDGQVERLRLQLAAANSRNEVLEESLDDANQRLIPLLDAAGVTLTDDGDLDQQAAAALARIRSDRTELKKLRTRLRAAEARTAELVEALARQAHAARTSTHELEQLREQHITCRDDIGGVWDMVADLVTAAATTWDPDGDRDDQVQHAIDLINAASDQLNARYKRGEHIHQYPRGRGGRPTPCECGKPFPRPTRNRKGAA